MDSDINLAIELKKAYHQARLIEIPVIIVLNKTDAVPPVLETDPDQYSSRKQRSIQQNVSHCSNLQKSMMLSAQGVIAISSLILRLRLHSPRFLWQICMCFWRFSP